MQSFKLLSSVTALLFICSCGDKSKVESQKLTSTYEINGSDTINFTDDRGLKQGRWVIFDSPPQNNSGFTKSPPDNQEAQPQKSLTKNWRTSLEDGHYKDSKKQGVWTYFNDDGTVKNTVEYKDDVPVTN